MGPASSLGASSGAAAAWPFRTANLHMAAAVGRGGAASALWSVPGGRWARVCQQAHNGKSQCGEWWAVIGASSCQNPVFRHQTKQRRRPGAAPPCQAPPRTGPHRQSPWPGPGTGLHWCGSNIMPTKQPAARCKPPAGWAAAAAGSAGASLRPADLPASWPTERWPQPSYYTPKCAIHRATAEGS